MHRSGTSCLAGCLEERGLYLGEVANASKNNAKGIKENIQHRAINDDVLAMSGGSWDRPPERLGWNNALRERRDNHIANHSACKVWDFKDPRALVTLPPNAAASFADHLNALFHTLRPAGIEDNSVRYRGHRCLCSAP